MDKTASGLGGEESVLYDDLQQYLKSAHLNRSPPLPESDPNVAVTRDVLSALVKECFENVSGVGSGPWYGDIALMVQTSLELFSKALKSLEGVYRGVERAWLLSLLTLAGLMEAWSLYDPILDTQSLVPTPSGLRQLALDVTRVLSSALRRDFVFLKDEQEVQTWRVSKDLDIECSTAITDIIEAASNSPFVPCRVFFFAKSRGESMDESTGDDKAIFLISQASHAAYFVLDLLYLLISPSDASKITNNHFFADTVHLKIQTINVVFEYCTTSAYASENDKITVIKRLVEIVTLAMGQIVIASVLHPHLVRLLGHRISDGPKAGWEAVDAAVARAFEGSQTSGDPTSQIALILETLKEEAWDSTGDSLRSLCHSYLLQAVPWLTMEQLEVSRRMLSEKIPCDTGDVIIKAIENRLSLFSYTKTAPRPSELKRKRSNHDIRRAVETQICQQLAPSDQLLDLDDNLSEDDWASAVIDCVSQVYSSPLRDPSEQGRKSQATFLKRLPCLLQHPDSPNCSVAEADNLRMEGLISRCTHIVERLLEGKPESVTSDVWKVVMSMLRQLSDHATATAADVKLIAPFLRRGLTSESRSVRLEAGKAAHALIKSVQAETRRTLPEVIPIFDILHEILQRGKPHLKETAMCTLGLIGRTSDVDAQGRVILELITQLGQPNALIQAFAYTQLLALAQNHGKGPFALVSPHLQPISCYVVGRICSAPAHLTELCNFLGRTILDFLTITQGFVFPHLVGEASRDALEAVSKHLGKPVLSMLMPYADNILAHLLMLEGTREGSKGFRFLTILVQEVSNGSVSIQNLLNGHRLEIITELVINMADDAKSHQAVTALKSLRKKISKPTKTDEDLAAFLHPFTLGIFSQLNTALTTTRGRSSNAQKMQIIRSLGVLISTIGPSISNIAPQIMAMLQSMIHANHLSETTLQTWRIFTTTLAFRDFGPHSGPTAAAIVSGWPSFTPSARAVAKEIIDYILFTHGQDMTPYLVGMVTLDGIPELTTANEALSTLRKGWSIEGQLYNLLDRCINDNITFSLQSLAELKTFMASNPDYFQYMSSGDVFDASVGAITSTLLRCACRDGEAAEGVRLLAFDCMGALGALDPDRFDLPQETSTMTLVHNFEDQQETISFALHLIQDYLAGAYRAASDLMYQNTLAYALQELLRFCGFTADLIVPRASDVASAVRDRWNTLPKHVVEAVAALLESRLVSTERSIEEISVPVYPTVLSYREWVQRWTQHLISRVTSPQAKRIFDVFRNVVRHQDVSVARHLLPHLLLNGIISGTDEDRDSIRSEIVAVLEDQVKPRAESSADGRLLSAQTIFSLMDHISKWIRVVRQELMRTRRPSRQGNSLVQGLMDQLVRVDSVISSIDHDLVGQAALETKAFARALMNFEQLILIKQSCESSEDDLQSYYERLHQIYAHLDEPDGMQGVSSKVLAPSLDHQIREHESTGRWTSAQSCWEIKLQNSPDDIDLHLGLIRCLRNLGHYDTLGTHIRGVLSRSPQWSEALAGYRAEGCWMMGDWAGVREVVLQTSSSAPEISIGRLLLALEAEDDTAVAQALSNARNQLGAPITAAGMQSYRRCYQAVVNLQVVSELEMVHKAAGKISAMLETGKNLPAQRILAGLMSKLFTRLESTLPTFRAREPVLCMHRIALGLTLAGSASAEREVGRAWLRTAKFARKAGHSQTAYSAILQAKQINAPFAYIQSCKLVRADGEGYRALQELETAIARTRDVNDLYESEDTQSTAKALLLRARWRHETDRFGQKEIVQSFKDASNTKIGWESPYFYLGRYYDSLRGQADNTRAQEATYTYNTCRYFGAALMSGSKYIFQTMPRLLTLWLDTGEDPDLLRLEKTGGQTHDDDHAELQASYLRILAAVDKALGALPSFQWFTAFPQIVSRIEHPSLRTFKLLARIVAAVIKVYPGQALWLFTTVVQSKRPERKKRGGQIIQHIKAQPANDRTSVASIVDAWLMISSQLLILSDFDVKNETVLSMTKFPKLSGMVRSPLLLPLQSSMTVLLPAHGAAQNTHQPFPSSLPTFHKFVDEIEIMKSLQKPRKVGVMASDGVIYNWLCKPKDDLRKDARLMDFNSIINKLLKTNSESRRRQLHIRTYSVIPLNEECGLIEWVPGTIGFRHILEKLYAAKGVQVFPRQWLEAYQKARESGEQNAARHFVEAMLPAFSPVFHEWFIETFPEPTAWLGARLAYSRTAAVISMVGYILGLGDRHGENILFDSITGDTVHVDFNCLFEKGTTFAVPERVPFRLTQNLVDAMGVTGVEGVFRVASEVTMQILRENKDSLMSVLEAFVHDPLVEWEDERKNQERSKSRSASRRSLADAPRQSPAEQLRAVAQKSLKPIERKLQGLPPVQNDWAVKEVTTSNQVDALFKEATSPRNLAMMYHGWASWL
ncbi:serine/threonine-protein kinase M1 [Tulasnella sp. JGI-2019a]|nr:serine/threonine-protein kinase M1 [Tulasnella sp. JGI-2019a]